MAGWYLSNIQRSLQEKLSYKKRRRLRLFTFLNFAISKTRLDSGLRIKILLLS